MWAALTRPTQQIAHLTGSALLSQKSHVKKTKSSKHCKISMINFLTYSY